MTIVRIIRNRGGVITAPASAPAWVSTIISGGLQYGEWAKVGGVGCTHGLTDTNKPRDVKTVNPSTNEFDGITNNWSGGVWAPDAGNFGKLYIGPGGGHKGYPYNDVFEWDANSRVWAQTRAASSGAIDATFGEYSDGSPVGHHTYDEAQATPSLPGYPDGIYILPKSVNDTEGQTPSVSTPYSHFLDLANPSAGWVRLDPIPRNATRDSWTEAFASLWDRTRSCYVLWAMSQPQTLTTLARLNPLASPGSQWTEYSPANPNGGHGWNNNGIEQVLFHDESLDIYVTFDWTSTATEKYLLATSLTTFNVNGTTGFPITESGSMPSKTSGGALNWCVRDQCAYWWGGATIADVYRFKYLSGSKGSQGVAGNVTYVSSNVKAGTNTIIPATQGANDQKVYGRGQIVEWGNDVFLISFTDSDGNVYAFRVPTL